MVLGGAGGIHGDVLEFVRPHSAAGSRCREGMAVNVEGIITIRCIKQNLPLVGLDTVAFERIQVTRVAGIKVNDQLSVITFALEDEAVDVPLLIGNRLGSHEFNILLVFLPHVNDGVCLWPEFIGFDIVGFNGHIDDSSVAILVMQHQRNVPLLTLSASRL